MLISTRIRKPTCRGELRILKCQVSSSLQMLWGKLRTVFGWMPQTITQLTFNISKILVWVRNSMGMLLPTSPKLTGHLLPTRCRGAMVTTTVASPSTSVSPTPTIGMARRTTKTTKLNWECWSCGMWRCGQQRCYHRRTKSGLKRALIQVFMSEQVTVKIRVW